MHALIDTHGVTDTTCTHRYTRCDGHNHALIDTHGGVTDTTMHSCSHSNTCTHSSTSTHSRMLVLKYTHTNIYGVGPWMDLLLYAHTQTHTHTNTHTHTHTHTDTHKHCDTQCRHTRTYTHPHTHTHTYAHTHLNQYTPPIFMHTFISMSVLQCTLIERNVCNLLYRNTSS